MLPKSVRKYTNSALGERFQQILEEQMASLLASQIRRDPLLLKENTKSETSQSATNEADPDQTETKFLAARADNSFQDQKFAHKYQREIAFVASEPLLRSQASRSDTLNQKPWDGTELTSDLARRMLTDSIPHAQPTKRQKLIISPPVPWQERVKSARELSLDYKVGREDQERDKEKEDFREMYRERLLGPSMLVDASLPKATLGLIGTLADARINASIDQKTGKFEHPEMDSVRGKPLDRARLANSTDTTFFINDILNRQECLPPWIESQQGSERSILAFRRDLQKKWFRLIVEKLGKERSPALKKARTTAFRDMSEHVEDFKKLHSHYIEEKIALLNREIRSYNLQCPSSSLHKWKLVPETEVRKLFDQVMDGLDDLLQEWFEAQSRPLSDTKMLGIFDLSGVRLAGPQPEKLEIWKLVKLIFTSS